MVKIRIARAALLVLLAILAPIGAPASSWKQIIVRCSPEDLDKVRQAVGAAIVDAMPGHYLLTVPSTTDTSKIEAIRGKGSIEVDDNEVVALKRRRQRNEAAAPSTSTGGTVSLGGKVNYYGTVAPRLYSDQPASYKIELPRAHRRATGIGTRIAIIDTGVDYAHPTLNGVLLDGKNYVGRTNVASEWNDPAWELVQAQARVLELDQAQARVLELDQSIVKALELGQAQARVLELDQAQARVLELDQAQAKVLELDQAQARVLELDALLPAFGHGTMVAGLVHLVAPHAQIIPLKAFDASGAASEWNVVRAIHDAVDMGADVINMSFSSPQKSRIIANAIDQAVRRGVVVVAASGNDDKESPTYPASLENVVGVTALTLDDTKAAFANYGKYVDLSAPGVDLITTYPGAYAIASGTSDSAPLVAGVFALVRQTETRGESLRERVEGSADEINETSRFKNKLGEGRVNAARAVHSDR